MKSSNVSRATTYVFYDSDNNAAANLLRDRTTATTVMLAVPCPGGGGDTKTVEHTPTSWQRHRNQDDGVKAPRGTDTNGYTSATFTSTPGAASAAPAFVSCSDQDARGDSGDFDDDRGSEADRRDHRYPATVVSVVVHEVGIIISSIPWSNGTRAFV